ncbi:decapping endonuclease targeting mRNA [Malassezia brasiliensis]|uniref:Decapping nuclease n=1 Tax=Malassezia brasiliensis TaxID=1821822 RepID=A0AAF0DS27_9BASI|nr:decapping endonuclease targeting mRNA [Malassezia brasiliensis]
MRRPNTAFQPVRIQQPTLVSSFSYDEQKRLHLDDRSKRYFHDPPTARNHNNDTKHAADLNYGFERYHEQPSAPPPVVEALASELLRTQVITWRGILTKLCTAWSCHPEAPPMFRDGFELNVMMLGDTLIMEEVPPSAYELAAQARTSKSQKQQRAAYYGYSFESYCTATKPYKMASSVLTEPHATSGATTPPGWGEDVNTNRQWCHIVKTRLGDTRIIIGGEVDCVESAATEASTARESVVELKTSIQPRNEQDQMRLHAKMLRIYMQSFLLGVQSIVLGFRDQKGTLLSHEHYRTMDLPRLVRGKPGQWNANDNLAFGAHTLHWLHQTVRSEMERWSFFVAGRLKQAEQSFLGHLPLPCVEDAELDYPVYRVSFQPPFGQVTLRYVPPEELQLDGRRANRCGLVPTEFYRWATMPMPTAAEVS